MEKFHEVNGKNAEITLNKNIYPLVSVKKAISNFMSDAYIKIDKINKNNIIIEIELKRDNERDTNEVIGEFYNELLRESLRYDITMQTKNIRELIVGRALYTTCIDIEEGESKDKETKENYDLDEVAVNWFEKYGNIEE